MLKTHKSKIFFCLIFVLVFSFVFYFPARANPAGTVSFTADTIVNLSGISSGSLYVASSSQATSINISGGTLTVSGIPDGDSFTLKTPTSTIALKLTPSGGNLDLTFSSSSLSTGYVSQWTLTATGAATVAHIVGAPLANTWYAIKVDDVHLDSYQSDSSGEVSFTYSSGWSTKVFTIEQDTSGPTSFNLTAPVDNSNTSNNQPTFSWNASTDPDFSYYQFYLDGILNRNNLTGVSTAAANYLGCGSHQWHVRAIDNAGNGTNSSAFNLFIVCSGPSGIDTPVSETVPVLTTTATTTTPSVPPTLETPTTEPPPPVAATSTPFIKPVINFTSNLKIGNKNSNIKALQEYLNAADFKVAESGPGSLGNETEYFGPLTKAALIKFQEANAAQILIPLGLTKGTGYFGPSTRNFINYGSSTPIVVFVRGLDIKAQGEDVKRLQQLLNSDLDTRLTESGIGSPGNETDYFGSLTQKAVQKFQIKYGVVSDESDPGYGYVGPKTRAKLKTVFGQ